MAKDVKTRFNFDQRQYKPVGQCIYCGATDAPLTREHIIPYSLGGRTVLPKASCLACNKITREFEDTCARLIFGPLRIHQKYPTRHPQERPKTLLLAVIKSDGTREQREVLIADYPGAPIVVMKLGSDPGILRGLAPSPVFTHIEPIGFVPDSADSKEKTKKILAEGGPGARLGAVASFDMPAFAQLLAKIAHAYATAQYGSGSFVPLLPDVILGKDPNIAYFIGGADVDLRDESPAGAQFKHVQELGLWRRGGRIFLYFRIQLFKPMGLPVYSVIVGIPTPELVQRLSNPAPPKAQ